MPKQGDTTSIRWTERIFTISAVSATRSLTQVRTHGQSNKRLSSPYPGVKYRHLPDLPLKNADFFPYLYHKNKSLSSPYPGVKYRHLPDLPHKSAPSFPIFTTMNIKYYRICTKPPRIFTTYLKTKPPWISTCNNNKIITGFLLNQIFTQVCTHKHSSFIFLIRIPV